MFALLIVAVTIALIATRKNTVTRFTVDLGPGVFHFRNVNLKGGTCYEFRVTSDKNTDVDLYIEDLNGQRLLCDVTIGPSSYLQWVPPATADYRIKVWNIDPARANRSHVEINDLGHRVAQAPPPQPNFNPPIPPIAMPNFQPNFPQVALPPIIGPVTTHQIPALRPGSATWEILVTFPTTKNVQVQVKTVERDVDVDLFIEEIPTNRQVASDFRISPDCNCSFNAIKGKTYRFRVVNISQGVANSTITFTAP